jgi:hypothetical protein
MRFNPISNGSRAELTFGIWKPIRISMRSEKTRASRRCWRRRRNGSDCVRSPNSACRTVLPLTSAFDPLRTLAACGSAGSADADPLRRTAIRNYASSELLQIADDLQASRGRPRSGPELVSEKGPRREFPRPFSFTARPSWSPNKPCGLAQTNR